MVLVENFSFWSEILEYFLFFYLSKDRKIKYIGFPLKNGTKKSLIKLSPT